MENNSNNMKCTSEKLFCNEKTDGNSDEGLISKVCEKGKVKLIGTKEVNNGLPQKNQLVIIYRQILLSLWRHFKESAKNNGVVIDSSQKEQFGKICKLILSLMSQHLKKFAESNGVVIDSSQKKQLAIIYRLGLSLLQRHLKETAKNNGVVIDLSQKDDKFENIYTKALKILSQKEQLKKMNGLELSSLLPILEKADGAVEKDDKFENIYKKSFNLTVDNAQKQNYDFLQLEEENSLTDKIISIDDYNTNAKKSNKLILPQFKGYEGFINEKNGEFVYIKSENDDLEKAKKEAIALLATEKNNFVLKINTTQENSTTESQPKKIYSLRRIEERKNKEFHLLSKKTCKPFSDKEYEVLKKHLHCDTFKRLELENKMKPETPKLSESKKSKTQDNGI